eukprot:2434808-Amphidinium_carterae.1
MGVPVSAPSWSPTGALLHWLRGLQLTLKQGWLISATGAQLYVGPTDAPLAGWRHKLRIFLRAVFWWQAGQHRRDHQGAEDMDVEAMLTSIRAMPPQRQKVLAKVFTGGLIVDERLHRWQLRQRNLPPEEAVDGICTHCNMGVLETERHIFWECPKWA